MKIFRPVQLNNISQWFGKDKTAPDLMHFYTELGLLGHNGIDFVCPSGTPIYWNCSISGKVIINGIYNDGAKYVKILTEENGELRMHRFIHNLDSDLFAGQIVDTGDQIARADNTGKYTTGSHVHYDFSPVIMVGNSYTYAEPNNGYGGQIDPQPLFQNIFTVDYVSLQKKQISLLQQVVNLMKLLLGMKK